MRHDLSATEKRKLKAVKQIKMVVAVSVTIAGKTTVLPPQTLRMTKAGKARKLEPFTYGSFKRDGGGR